MSSDQEIIYNCVSKVDRTADGEGYAFIKLDAVNKDLKSLDSLINYPHLRIIDISNNGLTSLGSALLTQTHLMSLIATNNHLTTIDNSLFSNKQYLLYLDLSQNDITQCEPTSWFRLARLFLNKNQLKELIIYSAVELLQLEARSNLLITVTLGEVPKLQKLYLAQNQLQDISFIKDKQTLEILHLRDNLISSLKVFADTNFTKLTYLNLRNNQINQFHELDYLKSLTSLNRLNLKDNPICEMDNYRPNVIYRLVNLQVLDKEPINPEEREEGEQVRVQNEQLQREEEEEKEKNRLAALSTTTDDTDVQEMDNQ